MSNTTVRPRAGGQSPTTRAARSLTLLACLALVLGGLAAAEPAGQEAVSRVLAVNLWSSALDIRLGSDGAFQTLGLKSHSASQMVEFRNMQQRALMYRPTGTDTWQNMAEPDGKTSLYRLAPGKTYLILVSPDGKPGLYPLNAPETSRPRLAVVNATGKPLTRLEIGTGWHEGTVAQASGLAAGWTDFLTVPEGSFAGFWSYEPMPQGVSYYYTSGSDSLSLGMYPLRTGAWYLFIIWDDPAAQGSGGIIWDVSPAAAMVPVTPAP